MTSKPPELFAARERFMEIVAEFRPDLHRYCTRLVGSAIDGEDVVQETLAKAYYAMSTGDTPPLKPWLLRIAHNTAIDFLRRYDRRFVEPHRRVFLHWALPVVPSIMLVWTPPWGNRRPLSLSSSTADVSDAPHGIQVIARAREPRWPGAR